MAKRYDLIVIGGGPGGHAAALHAAQAGAQTAVIEKAGWGGTCTHRGCIPTKALLACSRRYAELKKLGRLGVRLPAATFDYDAMKRHQAQMVQISALGVKKTLQEAGAALLQGEGRIIAPDEVEWTAADGSRERLCARQVVIAWGSESALPPGVCLSERIMSSDGILALGKLPESLLIIGGSVIGVEFATLFAELGVPVTLIEMRERILPGEEAEAATLLALELKKMGVSIHTGVRMEALREEDSRVRLNAVPVAVASRPGEPPVPGGTHPDGDRHGQGAAGNAGGREFSAERVLVCTGRRPCLRDGELDALKIRYDRRGIVVDRRQMTSVPGIYAIGDVTGGVMLAHRAMQQGKCLASALCRDREIRYLEEAAPSIVYAHPQIARVGLTEEEAVQRGIAVDVRRSDFAANIIARATLSGPGFVKLLFAGDKLAGATIAGDQAGELIAPLGLAVAAGLSRRQLEEWIIPHPTLSEVLGM